MKTAWTPYRCPSCGSVFREHVCAGPYAVPTCTCGHPQAVHHLTANQRRATWCTVWAGPKGPCQCRQYEEAWR